MSSTFPSLLFLICALLISKGAYTSCAKNGAENVAKEELDLLKNPLVSLFFKLEDLKVGNKMHLCFPVTSPWETTKFFSRKADDILPFSSKHLPQLLRVFSFTENSRQGKAIATTLHRCESKHNHPMGGGGGEADFCATSMESMMESVRGVFGLDAKIDLLTTKLSPKHKIDLQNYTVLEEPNTVATPKLVGCHTMPYPYRVYFCHPQLKDPMVYKVSMGGDDGERIVAATICHRDTSLWDRYHIAFKVLKTQPGKSAICHFLPVHHFAWVSSPTTV